MFIDVYKPVYDLLSRTVLLMSNKKMKKQKLQKDKSQIFVSV